MASNQSNRFQSLDSSVEEFIDGQENENTKKKTKHDVALFHEFLVLKGEMRQMDELTPQELNKFLSEFLITVRKKEDNKEYEPNSLRAFFAINLKIFAVGKQRPRARRSFIHEWKKLLSLWKLVKIVMKDLPGKTNTKVPKKT